MSSLRSIANDVAHKHRISLDDLLGRSRRRNIAWPRQEAYALCYQTGRYSTPQLGRFFGRDHSTILHGIYAYADRLETSGADGSDGGRG